MLVEAIGSDDPWTALEQLAKEPPPGLWAQVDWLYRAEPSGSDRRRKLTWLVQCSEDPLAGALLAPWLENLPGEDAADVLRTAARRGIEVPDDLLLRFLADPQTRVPALDAIGTRGGEDLTAVVRGLLG